MVKNRVTEVKGKSVLQMISLPPALRIQLKNKSDSTGIPMSRIVQDALKEKFAKENGKKKGEHGK